MQQARAVRTYVLSFEADGSFRAEDVPPGTYELKIHVTKPSANPNFAAWENPADVLGSLTREVVVPSGDMPFDLGTQVVPMKDTGKLVTSVKFSASTVAGDPVSLEQYKGKYVVLAFWALWSDRSTEQLAAVQKLQGEWAADSRVVFVGASVDGDDAAVRQAVAARKYPWPQVCLKAADLATASGTFDIGELPAIYLIDPDGRVAGRNLEPDRLGQTLQRAVAKN